MDEPKRERKHRIFVLDPHSSIEENYNIFNECGLILRPNSKIINVEIQVLKSKIKKIQSKKKYIQKNIQRKIQKN